MITVVSENNSVSDREHIYKWKCLVNLNFLYKRKNIIFYFWAVRGRSRAFLMSADSELPLD